jgi:uncharacterized membrane protein
MFISKKFLKRLIILAILIIPMVVTFNNCKLYKEPIAVITKVHTEKISKKSGASDQTYKQMLTIKLMNTSDAGHIYTYKNSYTTSQFATTKYRKGQCVFLKMHVSAKNGGYGEDGIKIIGQKYDYIWAFMISLLVCLLFSIAGRRAVLIIASLGMNLIVFVLGVQKTIGFKNIGLLTFCMTSVFIVASLLILYGFSKKSFGAILSSSTTVLMVFGLYMLIICFSSRIEYEYIDYTNVNEPLEQLYISSLIFSLLGAVMDVSITINATVNEIMMQAGKSTLPDIVKSIKGVSNDIMGTMINVMFFTFVGDEIPIYILKLSNGYDMITLFSNGAVFEIIRFLIGAIGIVLAVPVSGFFAVILRYKMIVKKGE